MAIKPISCGISNINLQMVGKTGQLERTHGQRREKGGHMHGSQEGPNELQSCKEGGVLLPFTASGGNESTGGEGQGNRPGCAQLHCIRIQFFG